MDDITPSSYVGMGAIPYAGGTAFRVWAPNADQVYVTGTFNDWSISANPLAHEGDGFWSTEVPGAQAGEQYRYVIVRGSSEFFRIDPYTRDVTSSVGNSIIHDPHFDWGIDEFQAPPLKEMIIYEMHIGTFNDEPGGSPGDLHNTIERLPYLRDLGINAIEVMPVSEFAGAFSWGYNPAHLFAVESDYGGPRAFKEFVNAAHAQGIAIIFDVVYNHFGPGDLDIWQFDGWTENNLGGIYFYNDWRAQTPWGETRPDYGRREVRQYIRDNALMWLEEYRVDGLRWDMTAYIRNVYGNDNDPEHDLPDGWSLMQWINEEMQARQPRKISIAEDMLSNPIVTTSLSEGGAGFDAQWDAAFVHPVREAIICHEDQLRNVDAVCEAISHRYGTNAFKRVIYTESHDEVANGKARVPEEISPGDAGSWIAKKLSTLGAALVFTSPGIPMIFQGQEFLEDEWFHDQDPIDWSKRDTYSGIVQLFRDLIHLRRNQQGMTRGLCGENLDIYHINREAKITAFHRWEHGGPRDSVIVVVNLAGQSHKQYQIGLPREGNWKVRFNSDWKGYDPSFGNHPGKDTMAKKSAKDEMPSSGMVDIGAYSVIIMSQDA